MKTITLGLALSLLGGAALAQTPPAPKPPAPAAQPPAPPMPAAPPAAQAQQQAAGAPGQPAVPTPGGPPEGMIVETPNGFFLVRPGDPNPRRLDLGQGPGAMGRNGPPGPNAQAAQDGQGGDEMDEAADANVPPPPHMGRGPMPPRPPEGKGARFRIKTPNLTLGMKCPDDEPIKACVDAVSQLLDKANAPAH